MDDRQAQYIRALREALVHRTGRPVSPALFDSIPLINVTAAIDWWASFDEQRDGVLKVSRYHTILPPFPSIIFHGLMPPQMLVEGEWVRNQDVVDLWLVMHFLTRKATPPYAQPLWDQPHTASVLVSAVYMCGHGRVNEFGTVAVALDKAGAMPDNAQSAVLVSPELVRLAKKRPDADQFLEGLSYDVMARMHPVFFSIALMHAKNVVMRPDQPSRAARRRGDLAPTVKAYTLEVTGIRQQAATQHRPGTSQMLTALHLCRGNFATYSEAAPLFGKYVGTFWRPAHVKGTADRGVVEKDYRVKP